MSVRAGWSLAFTLLLLLGGCSASAGSSPSASSAGSLSPSSSAVPSSSAASPRATGSASASTSADGSERDVTGMGDAEYEDGPVNFFASKSGNIWCNLATGSARCWALTYDRGAELKGCGKGADGSQNFVDLRQGAAQWGCGSDIGGLPFLDVKEGQRNAGVSWWDAEFGSTAKIESDSGTVLAVLPAGKTLIDGDFRCTMGKEVVTCTNTATNHGFVLSSAGAKLT